MSARQLVALALAVGFSGACFAQANVDEVTKAGGVRMTKDELTALHAGGVTMSGALGNGTPYTQQNKADGTIAGNAAGGKFTLTGTWKIDDAGRYCHDVKASGGLAFNNCSVIWKAGSKYFASPDEAPGSVARERQFTK